MTRDSVIDKLHPSEKSPKHKKIPAALRSKTPEKSRKAHGVSPRQRKNSLKAPSPSTSGGRKSRARAVNLIKLFDAENKSTTKEQKELVESLSKKEQKKVNRKQKTLEQCVTDQDKISLPAPEECPILPDRPEHSVSLVSMKVDTTLSAETTPSRPPHPVLPATHPTLGRKSTPPSMGKMHTSNFKKLSHLSVADRCESPLKI